MTDGKEGFLINDPGDIATLAEKTGELSESASRAMMGAAGRAFATQHPFEEQTSQFLELYGEIASTKRHRHNRFSTNRSTID